jgi:hypothetical protein
MTFSFHRQHIASGTITKDQRDWTSLYAFVFDIASWNKDSRWRYWFDELPVALRQPHYRNF